MYIYKYTVSLFIIMPPKYKQYIFICTNERPEDHPRGSCAGRNSLAVLDALKAEIRTAGLLTEIRSNKCGCMDICESGPNILITPDNIWYKQVAVEDVPEIVEEHLKNGRPVQRLIAEA
ncbi:MAG: (2Fe-2S) ferredoxin domain-containing protein [Sphingobacteriia bacterium]|jgi:(2Fe-2S) ferredoxin|nr:(2Fe-2S) ferredoxin domain-containing protein [Sphingobacteriia bacterium]